MRRVFVSFASLRRGGEASERAYVGSEREKLLAPLFDCLDLALRTFGAFVLTAAVGQTGTFVWSVFERVKGTKVASVEVRGETRNQTSSKVVEVLIPHYIFGSSSSLFGA